MKKKVILFYPDSQENISMMTPPLSIMAVGASAEERGYETILFDERVDSAAIDHIMDIAGDTLCVGISSLTGPQIKSGLELSKKIKENFKDIPIVWGGWHPTLCAKQTLEHPLVDYVVEGPGEITFGELLKYFEVGGDLSMIKGLLYKKGTEIIENEARGLTPLDDLPSLAYHLIDMTKYPGRPMEEGARFTSIRAMQGCPFRCRFCAEPIAHKRKFTKYSTERLMQELKNLKNNYGIKEIGFMDPTFLLNKKEAKDFCEAMINEKINMKWQATVRITLIARMNDEELRLLSESGCQILHPGVETGSQEMMNYIQKDQKIDDVLKCAKNLKKVNIRGLYSFIVAFPGEKKGEISKVFDLVKQLKEIDSNCIIPVNFYTPYPRNFLYDHAIACGFNEPKTLEEWNDFSVRKATMPWVTKEMEDEVMKKDKYYLPAAYPSRILEKKLKSGRMKYVYRAFHKIAKWRVTNNNYRFTLDWSLLLLYWKFWGRYNRKLKFLHNIHFRW